MGKYDDFTRGDEEALLNRLGGSEMGRAIGSDKYTVKIVGNEVLLSIAMGKLFDRHGRRIPPSDLRSNVVDADRNFKLIQPEWPESLEETGKRLIRLQTHLKTGAFISVADFHGRALDLCKRIVANPQLANLAKGVGLPFCLEQMEVKDYGETLEKFLNAFGQAYSTEFPRRSFINYRQGNLKKQAKVVKGARHEEFLAKLSRGSVVGLYFPTALQGYSISAAREQLATLPKEVLLAGGLDIVASLIMYPDVLARDYQTPCLDCAALSWHSAGYSLYFGAVDDGA
ncbi:MAG: hypothetical protein AAB568_03115, partial [Patescibacteria group bacterium]